MESKRGIVFAAVLTLAALFLGFEAGRAPRNVLAQSRGRQGQTDEALDFQLSGIGPATALTVYNPVEHVLYVYPAVTAGSSKVNCSFELHVPRAGAPLERQNCGVGSLP